MEIQENNQQTIPPPEISKPKKWHEHKGVIVISVLVLLTVAVMWFYLRVNKFQNLGQATANHKPASQESASVKNIVLEKNNEEIILSSPNESYTLQDDKTIIQLRAIHNTTAGKSEKGLPYVKIGEGWLEIVHEAVIYSGGYTFSLKNNGCKYISKFFGDYYADVLDSCTLNVSTQATPIPPTPIKAQTFKKTYTLQDLNGGQSWSADGLTSEKQGAGFFAIRFQGYYMGNFDESKSPVPTSIQSGFDLVNNFGVVNIELGHYENPILGFQKEFILGSTKLRFKILNVGNTNTNCNSLGCFNVFDMEVESTAVNSNTTTPIIITYN